MMEANYMPGKHYECMYVVSELSLGKQHLKLVAVVFNICIS